MFLALFIIVPGSPALNAVFNVAFLAREFGVAPFDSHCVAAVRGGAPEDPLKLAKCHA